MLNILYIYYYALAVTVPAEATRIGFSISSILAAKNLAYPSLASAHDLKSLNPNF